MEEITEPPISTALKNELDDLHEEIENLQLTLADILAKVDSVVDNIAPLVRQVEDSPLFKMLGGKKKKHGTIEQA